MPHSGCSALHGVNPNYKKKANRPYWNGNFVIAIEGTLTAQIGITQSVDHYK